MYLQTKDIPAIAQVSELQKWKKEGLILIHARNLPSDRVQSWLQMQITHFYNLALQIRQVEATLRYAIVFLIVTFQPF